MATITRDLPVQNGHLEIKYRQRANKIFLDKVYYIVSEKMSEFVLPNIWFNGLPAAKLKGFKQEIVETQAKIEAEIVGQDLYLASEDIYPSFPLKVRFKALEHTFMVNPQLEIAGLEELVKNQWGCTEFRIYHCDSDPLEGKSTLAKYQINQNDELTVLATRELLGESDEEEPDEYLQWGKIARRAFVNFKDGQEIHFNKKAPYWRSVEKGLNLEGECKTEGCSTKDRPVCAPLGIGTFHMHEACNTACCPNCHKKIVNVTNAIFWDCYFSINGYKEGSDTPFVIEKRKAPNDKVITFTPGTVEDPNENIAMWKKLVITTTHTTRFCSLI